MKKSSSLIISIFVLLCFGVIGLIYGIKRNSENSNITKITVAEVTHSIFYAPWYVAIENGYFEENGIEIDLILTPGADKTAAAVLSGDAKIGFSGPEATIYVYNNGEIDYLQTFAALTKRDGQFLLGNCNEVENFDVNNLKGKSILAGRSGGMPLMVFNYALFKGGLDKTDVNIDTSVEFAALSGAFIGGQGDYVNLFEPTASKIEKEGYGCVLASLGLMSGEVPYTAFYAKKSYIKENKDIIKSFNKALNKALDYIKNTETNIIADDIKNQFPDTSAEDLINIINRYKDADSWWDSTYIEEYAFDRLQDLMIYNKALDKEVDFDKLVTNKYN